jgi:hypothetical protein
VPAGVSDAEHIVLVYLLADLDRLRDQVSLAVGLAAAGFVESELGVDQLAPVPR